MKKTLILFLLAALPLGAYFVLITPGNPFTRLFRAKISNTDAKVIVGPYPLEEDFKLLAQNGVTTDISLLNPALPYEKTLLEREQELGQKYGIKVINFPMTSILGQKMGDDYEKSKEAAADAIVKAEGKVYLHCYLGLHRAKGVKELAESRGVKGDIYTVRSTIERAPEAIALKEARKMFEARQYKEALERIKSIPNPEPDARILQAWCFYRLDDFAAARSRFAAVAKDLPDAGAAYNGLGYCDLRLNKLKEAENNFQVALKANNGDASSHVGLGLVRQRQGKSADAIRSFQEALKLQPENSEAKELLAKAGAK